MTNVARLLRGLPLAAAAVAVAITGLPGPAAMAAPASPVGSWWRTALHLTATQTGAAPAGRGVTVAVLSTGVAASQPDLTGSVTAGPDLAKTGRAPGGAFWGEEGTAVASLVAGHGTDGGTAGVAPGAKILSIPVTLEYDDPLNASPSVTGRLPGAIAAGIRYAVGHGATVIALPLDPGTLGQGDASAAGGSAAERAAVGYALDHDVVLVAPAGDNGARDDTVNYPAAYPGVIAVGATAPGGALAPFSVTRSYVAVTAPGTGGLTVAAPGGGYHTLATTDMSAALTAGVTALVRARYPRLTAAQVTGAIERGASKPPSGSGPGWGHGAVDAAAALTQAGVIAAALPAPSASPTAAPSSAAASTPASAPAPAGSAPAATRTQNPGHLLQSLVIGLAVAAGVLIAGLLGAITLTVLRRRRRNARRPGPSGTSPARHARGGAVPEPASPASGWPSTGLAEVRARAGGVLTEEERAAIWARSARFATGATGGPWIDPLAEPATGPVSPSEAGPAPAQPPAGRWPEGPARRPRPPQEQPPWPPARPPGYRASPDSFLPAEPAGFATAPPPDDRVPSRPAATSGPMYVWNPAAATSPQPAAAGDADEDDPGPADQATGWDHAAVQGGGDWGREES